VNCGQCSDAFTSPWLLLRHVHDVHALQVPVSPTDDGTIQTLAASSQSPNVPAADPDAAGSPPAPQEAQSDDAGPAPARSTSPRSEDLDWPPSLSVSADASPRRRPEAHCRTPSPPPPPPVEQSTRLPSRQHKLQRYLQICSPPLPLRDLFVLMRPVATAVTNHHVAWSVCFPVGHERETKPCKIDEPIKMPFGGQTGVLDGGPDLPAGRNTLR